MTEAGWLAGGKVLQVLDSKCTGSRQEQRRQMRNWDGRGREAWQQVSKGEGGKSRPDFC